MSPLARRPLMDAAPKPEAAQAPAEPGRGPGGLRGVQPRAQGPCDRRAHAPSLARVHSLLDTHHLSTHGRQTLLPASMCRERTRTFHDHERTPTYPLRRLRRQHRAERTRPSRAPRVGLPAPVVHAGQKPRPYLPRRRPLRRLELTRPEPPALNPPDPARRHAMRASRAARRTGRRRRGGDRRPNRRRCSGTEPAPLRAPSPRPDAPHPAEPDSSSPRSRRSGR